MSLILPGSVKPSNLHLAPHQINLNVEGDVYRILDRLKEEIEDGHRLFVVVHEGHPKPFVVMERCDDGVDRYVWRYETLDERMLTDLKRARKIPLRERLKKIEAEEKRWKAAQHQAELDELTETLGLPMLHQLNHDGFTVAPRPTFFRDRSNP